MGLNKAIAIHLAESRLAEWCSMSYESWCAMIDQSDLREVVAQDGNTYSVDSEAFDDGDGRVRMRVAVDDGGWSAYSPMVRGEIMRLDGTFVS